MKTSREKGARWGWAWGGMLLAVVGMGVRDGQAAADAVLVIPRRQRTVEFAFDIRQLRNVELVVYDTSVDGPSPRLHRWNSSRGAWDAVDFAAYQAGQVLRPAPGHAFVIGDRPAEVELMAQSTAWCRDVVPLTTLRYDALANALHEKLRFTEREWSFLERRHGLQVEDPTADQRKHGRYGPPGPRTGPPADLDRNPLVQWYRKKESEARSRQAPRAEPAAEPTESRPVEREGTEAVAPGPAEESPLPQPVAPAATVPPATPAPADK